MASWNGTAIGNCSDWNPRTLPKRSFDHSPLDVLYDPEAMPPALRRAHRGLDRAVDRLYRRAGFASERERIEHLFILYPT